MLKQTAGVKARMPEEQACQKSVQFYAAQYSHENMWFRFSSFLQLMQFMR